MLEIWQRPRGGTPRGRGMAVKVPAGYKQTEVGVIPEDWEVQSVNHVCVIRTGPFGTLLKASEYSVGDGVPLISVGEIRHGFLKISNHTPSGHAGERGVLDDAGAQGVLRAHRAPQDAGAHPGHALDRQAGEELMQRVGHRT